MIPIDIVNIISGYARKYTLRDWIDEKKISLRTLTLNPDAIHILEKNLDKLDTMGWIG
jgi:hypothetical protein